jgi:hypothetical protein
MSCRSRGAGVVGGDVLISRVNALVRYLG